MKPSKSNPTQLDQRLSFLEGHLEQLSRPPEGWLRSVRNGLGVSQREAAASAGVTQQAFDQFESGELRNSITLERLQNAAAALGCELVYFLKPKSGGAGSFATLAERRARGEATRSKSTRAWTPPSYSDELPVNLL